MTRAIIYFVLGAVLLGLGIWWWTIVGPSFAFLAPFILQGVGGAFMVAGWQLCSTFMRRLLASFKACAFLMPLSRRWGRGIF